MAAPGTPRSHTDVIERDGASIAYEEFGSEPDPLLILVSGAGTSRDWWDREFCERLVAGAGDATYRVIRYDLRDAGESSKSAVGHPDYTADDLLTDLVALIDARTDPGARASTGAGVANVAGVSLGGGLVQQLALRHPDRVASLTILSSSPAGPGSAAAEQLPPPTPQILASFETVVPDPDWASPESVADWFVETERPFAGSIPVDEDRVRRIAAEVVARGGDQSSAANHVLVAPGSGARDDIESITAPTLVLHGSADPLFPLAHGERLAELIPGARLVVIPGHGHQNPPPPTWDLVVPAILEHLARADAERSCTRLD